MLTRPLTRMMVWIVLAYGTEGWTLTDKSWRENYRISRTVDLTSDVTSQGEWTRNRRQYPHRALLGCVMRRKLSFFRHTTRGGGDEVPHFPLWSMGSEWEARDSRNRAGWRRMVRCAARSSLLVGPRKKKYIAVWNKVVLLLSLYIYIYIDVA